ncbi:MAG: mandelate racemase/muconate lactonizing enzyme family protein [Janthinobacterium lividum]
MVNQKPMRIAAVDVYPLEIPFTDGGAGIGLTPVRRWDSFETVLLRITTDDGQTGWGEAFAYACQSSVAEAVRHMVAPLLIGRDASDPATLMLDIQRKLHLFGRYGITMFAISGADIALWDLKARSVGMSLAALLGTPLRQQVSAYASLVRYADPALVERFAAEAVSAGYRSVKLHEIDPAIIHAGRRGAGPGTHLTVDVNCAWSLAECRTVLPALEAAELAWLEEPLFPPEDFDALAELAGETRIPLAAGENACTGYEFARMIRSAGARYPQPSVTKVGGVTEFMAVLRDAASHGLTCMPHSPYFGPGYWATLQLLAHAAGEPLLEVLYVSPEAMPGLDTPMPLQGSVIIPAGPGIGFKPDWDVFERYAARAG